MCKIGLHLDIYTDSAFFYRVDRCADCSWVSNKDDAKLLADERAAWKQVATEPDYGKAIMQVMDILNFTTETMENRG